MLEKLHKILRARQEEVEGECVLYSFIYDCAYVFVAHGESQSNFHVWFI